VVTGHPFFGTQSALIHSWKCSLRRGAIRDGSVQEQEQNEAMGIVDLLKATVICGGGSLVVYSFPVVGQVLVISIFGLLWLLYAREAIVTLRRR